MFGPSPLMAVTLKSKYSCKMLGSSQFLEYPGCTVVTSCLDPSVLVSHFLNICNSVSKEGDVGKRHHRSQRGVFCRA
jgi:hypothetical protein